MDIQTKIRYNYKQNLYYIEVKDPQTETTVVNPRMYERESEAKVDDTIFAIKPRTKYDDRNEPSDGRYVLNYRYFNHRYSKDKESTYYWIKRLPEYQRKIKPKVREYKH